MKIKILTIFPEMFTGFLQTSIIKRALTNQLVDIEVINFRQYSNDKSKRVDDYPYGGGAGMVLMCQPILDCLNDVRGDNSFVLLTSPEGVQFNQSLAKEWSKKEEIVIICGHYEGYDGRIYDYVDQRVSVGDYVLTGGELPAMIIADAITRLLKDVISSNSTLEESFEDNLLEYKQYTRPENYNGKKVPEVLLSGHHENIRRYRLKERLRETYLHRPDLLAKHKFTDEEKKMLAEIKKEDQNVIKNNVEY
ncbi:MAG: tRNA (guanosine(37)-N1)-methyltransferase TrmD [Erysipelotrichia bacterium]|nr:tRNA (guanosine(37)-N1)-methyltransferase TrmD [Erysipelotrichia bacterium]